MLIWLGDIAGWDPPLIDAVRWVDAAFAAGEGSREGSATDFPSGIDWGICVGEFVFGVEPKNGRLMEIFRATPMPLLSGAICDDMCVIVSSWPLLKLGLEPGYGSGCD